MALADPSHETHQGRYDIDGTIVTRPNGTTLVQLGDDIVLDTPDEFLDLTPSDYLLVSEFERSGDVVFVCVVGSDKVSRFSGESLDALFEAGTLRREPR